MTDSDGGLGIRRVNAVRLDLDHHHYDDSQIAIALSFFLTSQELPPRQHLLLPVDTEAGNKR